MNMEAPKAANDNEKPKEWGMSDAIAEIGIAEQRIGSMGNKDEEGSFFARLRIDVINSNKTPTEAVEELHRYMNGRQER